MKSLILQKNTVILEVDFGRATFSFSLACTHAESIEMMQEFDIKQETKIGFRGLAVVLFQFRAECRGHLLQHCTLESV